MKKPHCYIPWTGLSILPDGNVLPCVAANPRIETSIWGNIKNKKFKDIWNSQNAKLYREKHLESDFNLKSCSLCAEMDSKSNISRRNEFESKYGNFYRSLNVKHENTTNPEQIIFLDFALSTMCNLSCTICSSTYSTSWMGLEKSLKEQGFKENFKEVQTDGWENVRKNLEGIFAYLENLYFVVLKGGEPLLSTEVLWFLEELVKRGIAPQVELSIITNGTIYNKNISNLLSHFKFVALVVSLDATDELFSYIRGGKKYGYEDVIKNIENFKKNCTSLKLVAAPTLQAYNGLRYSQIIKKIFPHFDEVICKNWVIEPIYQSIDAIPNELRPSMAMEMQKTIDFLRESDPKNKSFDFLEYMKKYLNNEVPLQRSSSELSEDERFSKLKNYTKCIDHWRGMRLSEVLPEMSPYLY